MKIAVGLVGKTLPAADFLSLLVFSSGDKKTAKNQAFKLTDSLQARLEKKFKDELINAASREKFEAHEGTSLFTYSMGLIKAQAFMLTGLGARKNATLENYRRAAGEVMRLALRKKFTSIAIVVNEDNTLPTFDVTEAIATGLILASYRFNLYHTKEKHENTIKSVEILFEKGIVGEESKAIKRAEIMASGVNLARDLINEAPRTLNPEKLSKVAKEVATAKSGLSIEVLNQQKLEKERMGLLLAVGQASTPIAPPCLVRMAYEPAKAKKTIVLVGKGVTFDSGGLDIKPADGMLEMKVDMSGAAAVIGIMKIIAELKPKCNVIGYLACVENGIGARAYHPGDVITSRKGITVEISNTDAEGRLIMADTFTYAQDKDKPNVMINIATLTGACVVALGPKTAGIFSNNDDLAEQLIRCGDEVGESYWRMPLTKSLRDGLKTSTADIKNCGDRWGGAITAALFLEEFVNEGVHWSHLDIAGPATNNKAHPYLPHGGVGFSIRTLVNFLMEQ